MYTTPKRLVTHEETQGQKKFKIWTAPQDREKIAAVLIF